MAPTMPMQPYQWLREGWSGKRWHLLAGDHRVATLERRGGGHDLRLADGVWRLDRQGFWVQRLLLTDPRGVRRLEARVRSSRVDVTGHPWGPLAWRITSWWRGTYELQAPAHGVAVHMKARGARGDLAVDSRLPDAVPLLALGWVAHLTLQGNATAAATAATVAATTAG